MAATDARPIPIKNTAFRAVFPILDADGDLVTGATGLDSEVSKNQGTFADCTNEATEIATSSGMYYLDLTATEMNADCVAVIVKTSSSGAKTTVLVFYPEETGDINVDVSAWLGTAPATPTTAGVPEVDVTHWLGTAAATPTVAGVPEVDLTHVGGATTNVAALATNVDAILTDTADMQPKLGTPAGASISADILAIDNFVDGLESTIGAAGAGLTAIPWNAAWDAEVQSEVDDALVAQNLDHLVKIAVDTDFATTVHLDSVIGHLADAGTTATFDRTTDSAEALQAAIDTIDNLLDTEVGALTTELAKVPKSDGTATWNATALASIQSEANDALVAYDPPTKAELDSAVAPLALEATLATVDNLIDTEISTLITMLTGIVPVNGTIGATGNSTTALHLDGIAWADDGPNSMLLTIQDVSTGLYYSRWIEDFATTGDIATVATLPFTPEASVDKYWLTPVRADVTGGSGLDAAGVRAAIGLASANLDTQLAAIDDAVDTEVAAALAAVDTEVAAIKAKTDNLPAAPAATGDIPTAAAIADAVWDEDATAHQTQGTFGQAIGDPGADTDTIYALLNTIAAYLDTEVAAILADTNELQTDLTNGGRLDLLIDAIKAKTDSLTFTTAGQVDAQVLSLATGAITAGSIAADAIGASELAADAATEIATAVWASATRTLSALGFTLGASDLAADTIGASELAADAITEIVNAVLTTAMTESYNVDGAAPTLAQALFVTMQRLTEFAISGTTITVKKLDGSTSAYTLTLDDATNPTSTTRAS